MGSELEVGTMHGIVATLLLHADLHVSDGLLLTPATDIWHGIGSPDGHGWRHLLTVISLHGVTTDSAGASRLTEPASARLPPMAVAIDERGTHERCTLTRILQAWMQSQQMSRKRIRTPDALHKSTCSDGAHMLL